MNSCISQLQHWPSMMVYPFSSRVTFAPVAGPATVTLVEDLGMLLSFDIADCCDFFLGMLWSSDTIDWCDSSWGMLMSSDTADSCNLFFILLVCNKPTPLG